MSESGSSHHVADLVTQLNGDGRVVADAPDERLGLTETPVMPHSCPPEFRRKVIDLVASGRKTAEVAQLLGVSDRTIYVCRRQHLIDTGQLPGTTCPNLLRPASVPPSWGPSWPSTGGLPSC
ncbi:helix-turn-helix domain-containing protein [Streptomyces mirabilis]|uniref:helix-turn-helix domain-containing protein n=1 Tax=Streptomyces mirabilis TaxID=68239 RepID=UPI0036796DD2